MNRYKITPIFQVNKGQFYGLWQSPIKEVKLQSYIIQEGDRLDILAQKFLGDFRLWWVIAFLNNIQEPLNLPVGLIIQVPTEVVFVE